MSNKSKLTYDLLVPIFESIDKTFTIDNIIDNGGGSYTLESCNTLWVTIGYTVTIDSIDYTVTTIVPDESITISGSTLPTAESFEVYDPFFRHGTLMATRAELAAEPNQLEKYPMIFMHEKTSERFNHDEELSIERESRCKFYALVPCDIVDWIITDHDLYAIRPMRNLMNAFLTAIREATNVHDEGLIESEWMDENKFGVYVQSSGMTKAIFSDNLSGTGLDLTIPFLEIGCENECETPAGTCDPVEIIDQDGDRVAFVDPGDQYRVLRFDGIVDNGPPYENSIVAIP